MFEARNVLRFAKGDETYIFAFDDKNRTRTCVLIAQFAANPELSLTWDDAVMLGSKIRQTPTCEESDDATNISPCCKQSHNRRCAG
jgi:hypothetical protein